ncbi:MAG: hypothetical protein ACJ76H_14320 [Bacteriovoracaceae bacterium]
MRTALFLSLFIVTFAYAADDFKVDVNVLDPDVDSSQLMGPHTTVHEGLGPAPKVHDQIPVPLERDRLFAKAGLADSVKDWDDLDRDIFFRKARAMKVTELAASYPKLPVEKLKTLKSVIHEK